MRNLVVTLCILLLCTSLSAEGLINGPESVEFDEARERYLVSNWNEGSIVAIDSLGNQSYFITGIDNCGGICVSGDTLWIAADFPNRIVAVDLITAEILQITYVNGADFFDSIVRDTSGYVYVTEGSSANDEYGHIYKMKISDQSYYVYADSGICRPQAIRFDPEENALILCSVVAPSKIQKITLNDSTLHTLVESTMDLSMDGIAFDDFGNTYVSSWSYNGLFRFDSNYTDPPDLIATGFGGPSALYYNRRDNILAAPDYLGSRVEFIPMFVQIECDSTMGWAPLELEFTGISQLTVDSWTWDFDDGDIAYTQSPTHTFTESGIHTVNLEIEAEGKVLNRKENIIILADTLVAPDITLATLGTELEVEIYAHNSIPLDYLYLPVEYPGTLDLSLDSFSTAGYRTEILDTMQLANLDNDNKRAVVKIWNSELTTAAMDAGDGTILKLYFTISPAAVAGQSATIILDGYSVRLPQLDGPYTDAFMPMTVEGTISTMICGDVNGSGNVNLLDVTYLLNYLYKEGPDPDPYAAADVNASGGVNLLDVTYLINYLYKDGPLPNCL